MRGKRGASERAHCEGMLDACPRAHVRGGGALQEHVGRSMSRGTCGDSARFRGTHFPALSSVGQSIVSGGRKTYNFSISRCESAMSTPEVCWLVACGELVARAAVSSPEADIARVV